MADSKVSTGRLLVGLTAVATVMTLLGIAAVWAFAYGPL